MGRWPHDIVQKGLDLIMKLGLAKKDHRRKGRGSQLRRVMIHGASPAASSNDRAADPPLTNIRKHIQAQRMDPT